MSPPILAPVDPIGIGTPACESLSSYVQRLAWVNQTVPGQLVFRVLAWYDQAASRKVGSWARRPRRLRIGSNINSFSHADAWTRVLHQSTGLAHLDLLTTRAWDAQFPTRGFQTSMLMWCPCCLTEDESPYHRLAWSLQPASVCAIHRIVLQQRCGKCRKPVPVLHDRSLPTQCPWCRGDLRVQDRDIHAPASSFALWCADELGAIIAASSEWHRGIAWCPAQQLGDLGRSINLQDAASFAAFIGTSKITAWYWLRGKAAPSLPFALHVYHRFGKSLAVALGCQPPQTVTWTFEQPEFHLRKLRPVALRHWPQIKVELQRHRRAALRNAIPLRAIAAAYRLHVRTLREHFPALCRSLASRYRQKAAIERKTHEARLKKQILKAAVALARLNHAITPRNLERRLKQPGLFNQRAPRRILTGLKNGTGSVIQ